MAEQFVRSRLLMPEETWRSFFDPNPEQDIEPVLPRVRSDSCHLGHGRPGVAGRGCLRPREPDPGRPALRVHGLRPRPGRSYRG